MGEIKKAVNIIDSLLEQNDDIPVQQAGIQALVGIEVKSAIPKILKKFNDEEDPEVKKTTIQALVALHDESVLEYASKFFKDKNSGLRIEAIKTAMAFGEMSFLPEIENRLKDSELLVQRWAVFAVEKLNAKSKIPQLIKLITERNESQLKIQAIHAIGKLGDESEISKIATYLNDEDNEMQLTTILALGDLHDKLLPQKITEYLDHYLQRGNNGLYNIDYRIQAALQNFPAQSIGPALIACLDEKDEKRKLAAIILLGDLGISSVAPRITTYLDDENKEIRWGVIKTLGSLLAESATEELIKLLDNTEQSAEQKERNVLSKSFFLLLTRKGYK